MNLLFLIILIAHPIQSMNLEINGKINLGPNWHHQYRTQKQNSSEDTRRFRSNVKDSIVKDIKVIAGNKLAELFKNFNITSMISNLNINADVGGLSTETHLTQNKNDGTHKKHKSKRKQLPTLETTTESQVRMSKKHKHQRESPEHKRHKTDPSSETSIETSAGESIEHVKGKDVEDSEPKHSRKVTHKEKGLREREVKTTAITTTATDDDKHKYDIYLQPIKVKDDPQLVKHIKHIHTQSLKVIDDLKTKTDNHDLKKQLDLVLKGYDEKYKEFVTENKHNRIKSRIGKKKVILNAADVSNKILDRLVTYVRGKVESSGLRSGVANEFYTALKNKRELENQRMCKKFGVCRSGRTYRHFLIDIFTIVIESSDEKAAEFQKYLAEVLKTRDFTRIMSNDIEKSFRDSLTMYENFDLLTLRGSFFIMRNILENLHEPIKVTETNGKSINKTVALIDIVDTFEEKIPPNDKNKLEWEDMLNSMNQWSRDERKDIYDILQNVVDHGKKGIDAFDDETAQKVQHNIQIMFDE